jgi:serine/threonine-protein kinase
MTAIASDRNLLFGLLALQNGLINQAQLVAAFQAWTLDRARSLADHLIALGHLNHAQRAVVEAMADLHVTKHGDIERSLAAVSAGRSTRESLAQIADAQIHATLARLGSALTDRDHDADTDSDRTASYSVGTATSDGQRFRVLRPHARGGLGAVFVALDCELNREVALKQILERHADDPTSRQRFLVEAEITGGLEHPGIVPVYGLGTYAGGRPFYAMRFVKGDSLKEAIEAFHRGADSIPAVAPTGRSASGGHRMWGVRGRSSPESAPAPSPAIRAPSPRGAEGDGKSALAFRKLLRRFLDVCNAIDYAHSRGVLHRDIKPGNIIVGKHGETLVVDWGLAKAVGGSDPGSGERTLVPSSASGSGETLPGSALGTPAYMSPEQAAGDLDRLGPRSDVYSLGATLYCLLTGKPPQDGDDVGEMLRRAQRGDFPRPRQLDSSIDPALEAICLTAMATNPDERYASCRALAEDVERWMADEPTSAYREPVWRRARRWAKRYRTAVATAAVALLAGVVGLSAVLVVQTQAKADIARSLRRETQANVALAAANNELARSRAAVQARYDLAVDAIKTFHTGVSEDFLLKEDQFKELRDRLLNSASDFYRKLGALLGKETDVASRRALEQSNFELAELTRKVGRIEAALAAHQAALAAREALAAETGASTGIKADVGRSLTAVAYLLYWTGKVNEGIEAYRRAESLLAGVAGSDPEARAALAVCRTRMARPLLHAGKTTEALAACKLARADQEALASIPAASNDSRHDLADTLNELGIVLWQTNRPAEAEPELRTALAIQQQLVDKNPADIDFRNYLANIHLHLGNVLRMTGKVSEAEPEFHEAMAIYQKLIDQYPAITRSHRNLALCRSDLAVLLSRVGRLREAEAEQRAAMAILQRITEENPANTDAGGLLANSHRGLGHLLALAGKAREAEAECRTALAIDQKMAGDDPKKTFFRSLMAESRVSLGHVLLVAGKPGQAEAECRIALAIFQELADENPGDTIVRDGVASSHIFLGDAVRLIGRPTEARSEYERAIALLERPVQQNPAGAWHRYMLACAIRRRGLILRDLGDLAGAAADARRSLALCGGPGPRSVEEVFETACCHAMLASLAGRAGSGVSANEGAEETGKSMEWLRRAVAMGYRKRNELRLESALDPLRSRDDFQLLFRDLAMPAQAIAPDR